LGGFEEMVSNCTTLALRKMLGEGGEKAVAFHLRLVDTKNPNITHEKIVSMFGLGGAEVLERAIVNEILLDMRVASGAREPFDFLDEMRQAQEKFGVAWIERRTIESS
jgi:stalled ribosome rescue protein Dom34